MFVEIDGSSVYVATSEAPAHSVGPCIVLVHGAQNDHRVWADQLAWFAAQGYATFAPDLPGHGRSHGKPLINIESMGKWLTKLLTQILPVGADNTGRPQGRKCPAEGTPLPILVGHSMGSLAVLECAAHQTTGIAALVLVGTAFPMKVSPGLLEQTRSNEAAAITQIAQWSYAPALADASQQVLDLRRDRLATAEQLMNSQAAGVLHSDLSACNSYQHGLEAAKLISVPTLIVAGSKDQMTPPKFALALREVLAAELQTIHGAGHSMMNEQSDHFCGIIHQFLSRHDLAAQLGGTK